MSATAAGLHRGPGGRFATRTAYPTCQHCGSVLLETLLGELRCLSLPHCPHHGETVGTVPGVELGTLAEVAG